MIFLEPDPRTTIAALAKLESARTDCNRVRPHRPHGLDPLFAQPDKPFLGLIAVDLMLLPASASLAACALYRRSCVEGTTPFEQLLDRRASWRKMRVVATDVFEVLLNDGSSRRFFLTRRGMMEELVDRLGIC